MRPTYKEIDESLDVVGLMFVGAILALTWLAIGVGIGYWIAP